MGKKNLIAVLILALVIAALPLFLRDNYSLGVLVIIGIYSLITLGLSLLMGYAGQISLGHAAFYGIGAYCSGLLCVKAGWSPWLALVAAMMVSGGVAFVMGQPILRLRGHYLAMATLAFGIIIYIFFEAAVNLTGGPSGFGSIPRLTIGDWKIKGGVEFFYLVWLCVLAALVLSLNIVHSRVGRALRSIHGSEQASSAMGVNTSKYKVQIFVLSACLASLAGSLYAHYVTFIGPSSFDFKFSVTLVTMVAVGGMSNLWGALAGTAILRFLPEVLGHFEDYHLLIYGGILIVILMYMPEGLVLGLAHGIQKLIAALRSRKRVESQ